MLTKRNHIYFASYTSSEHLNPDQKTLKHKMPLLLKLPHLTSLKVTIYKSDILMLCQRSFSLYPYLNLKYSYSSLFKERITSGHTLISK